jgi:hypothetical protein
VTSPAPYTPTWQTILDFLHAHLASKSSAP